MRIRSLFAALADTGVAAASTFLVGITAAISMQADILGAHQLIWSVTLLLSLIPFQRWGSMILRQRSLALFSKSAFLLACRRMLVLALCLSALLVLPAVYLTSVLDMNWSVVLKLGLGGMLVTVALPFRDSLRGYVHVSDRRLLAVAASCAQLVVTILGIIGVVTRLVSASWLLAIYGMGLLAACCLVFWGLSRLEWAPHSDDAEAAPLGLVMGSMMPQLGGLFSSWLVGSVRSLSVLGYLAAASQIGQGLYMFVNALNMLFLSDSTRAGAKRDRGLAIATRRRFAVLVGVAGLALLPILVVPHFVPAFARWMPNAYVIPFLGVGVLLAIYVERLCLPLVNELTGAGRFGSLARVQVIGSLVSITACLSVWLLGAFAVPFGMALGGLVKYMLLARSLRDNYATPSE